MEKISLSKNDVKWVLGLFGTAIGAGVLFLPVNAGLGGIIPLMILAIIAFPMAYFSHRGLSRFVMSSNSGKDITCVVEEHFGKNAGKIFTIFYFFSIYPIVLIYSIGLVNTISDFMINQLHIMPINRALMSFILVASLVFIASIGRNLVVKIMSLLVFPFIIIIVMISIYLITKWNLTEAFNSFSNNGNYYNKGIISTLWITIPVMIFSFNHSPVISSFTLAQQEEYRDRGKDFIERKCRLILKYANVLMVIVVMFFVFSCIFSLSQEDLVNTKSLNVTILTYLSTKFNQPFIAFIAPIIAIVAISKSFLGHYLGVNEAVNGMLIKIYRDRNKVISISKLNLITAFFVGITAWIAATLNLNVFNIIERLAGPVIACILFLLPVYGSIKIPAMRKYIYEKSNIFVGIIGSIAVLSSSYSFFY